MRTLEWVPIIALIMLSVVIAWLGNGYSWLSPFIFTSAYVTGRLPTIRAALAVAILALITIATGIFTDPTTYDVGQTTTYVVVVGIVTISLVRSFATSRELRAAREEIARLAVMTERLRIARDLHDLLGHNLSLITLKSELAGRLVPVAPERAIVEIRDVENVARTTLQEVREAVAGYRQPNLDSELHGAREILAAAGIAYHYEGAEDMIGSLPSTVEAVLAWTVREGVTNVIRHSHAYHCSIAVARDSRSASVVVTNDGDRIVTTMLESIGDGKNGLRGLTERVKALGGQCEAGRATGNGGGFRLAVSVPLTQKNSEAGQSDAATDTQAHHMQKTHEEQPGIYAERSEQV
jgi:two-component system sensor histidine kinase DesK